MKFLYVSSYIFLMFVEDIFAISVRFVDINFNILLSYRYPYLFLHKNVFF